MAELLILAKTAEMKNAKWNRGDVIAVMPDGHEWGKEERLPKFYVVRIPRAPVEDYQGYLEAQMLDTKLVDANGEAIIKLIAPRKWKFELDTLSKDTKDALESKGATELSSVDTRSSLTEKKVVDGNRET